MENPVFRVKMSPDAFYRVVVNTTDLSVVHGTEELVLEMIASKLNDALAEAIAEIQFLSANCQGEVV